MEKPNPMAMVSRFVLPRKQPPGATLEREVSLPEPEALAGGDG
jgi:hypothetical protein